MDPTNGGIGNIATGLGQIATGLAPIAGTAASLYGQQNASEAVVNANNAAIANQNTTLGNINGIYSPYTTTGASATGALGAAEGLNGAAPNYSAFENMPGYKFAVDQGTQAIQRQAAASGSAYTPNTQAAVGQYVTGTAMQDYNTYIQQLQATAGMGATAANQIGNITYNTGANTSQLMANTGQSQAGMYTGMGQTVSSALGGAGGFNGSGVAGAAGGAGGVVGGIGNIASGVSNLFGGGSGAPATPPGLSNPYDQGTVSGYDQYGNAIMGGPSLDTMTGGNVGTMSAGATSQDFLNSSGWDPNSDLYDSAVGS